MSVSTRTLRTRVRRGVEFLNERRPSWINSISVQNLDLGRCDLCVLGQIYGMGKGEDGYSRGLEVLNGKVQANPAKFGFIMEDMHDSREYYAKLNKIWAEEIAIQRQIAREGKKAVRAAESFLSNSNERVYV